MLFPVFCFGCGKEKELVCELCFARIPLEAQMFCPVCHVATQNGEVCEHCVGSHLVSHLAMVRYAEQSLVGSMVHAWKYEYVEGVYAYFARMTRLFIEAHPSYFETVNSVVAVPLHRRRLAQRGFNQADLLARVVANEIKRSYKKKAIVRYRYTAHQARKTRDDRLKNVVGAFRPTSSFTGETVLLVDDVFTTGTTMQECANVLLAAGAGSVKGFSIARG